MKLGFWVPTSRGWSPMLVRQKDIDTAAVRDAGHEYRWWFSESCNLPRMRNEALERARELGLDYLMMQDDDIYSPGDVSPMMQLVETAQAHDAALVGAVCGLRRIKLAQVVPNCRPLQEPGEVYEGDRIGTGMVLIDVRKVSAQAENYTGPWFGCTYKDERQTTTDFGEDFFFCKILRGLGERVVIDGRVPTVHAYTDHSHLRYPPCEA